MMQHFLLYVNAHHPGRVVEALVDVDFTGHSSWAGTVVAVTGTIIGTSMMGAGIKV